MLKNVSIQLELATLNLVNGFYRSAFTSLRLAFELGLGLVYFSVNKLEHNEWKIGKEDNKWSKLIDLENGILSRRFSNAFFLGSENEVLKYNTFAREKYRYLSEYVHGNNNTWENIRLTLSFDRKIVDDYVDVYNDVCEILLFTILCRYILLFEKDSIEQIVQEELSHIDIFRNYLGAKVDD